MPMPDATIIVANIVTGSILAAWTNKWAIDIIIKRVLPRKKAVFARRIQQVVSGELLTPEKMRGKLDDPQVADLFRRNLNDVFVAFLDRDLPTPEEYFAGHQEELDRLSASLRDLVIDEVATRCVAPGVKEELIRPWLAQEWERILNRSPRSLLPKPTADFTRAVIPWIQALATSTSLRRNARRALAGWMAGRVETAQSIKDLLPPMLRTMLLDWATEQAPLVGEQLASAMETPDLQATVADAVIAAVREQLGNQGKFGLLKSKLADWIGVEDDIRGFCAKLPATLRRTFEQPQRREELAARLRATTETWLQRELAPGLRSSEQLERFADMILDQLWRPETFSELAGRVGTLLEETAARSLREIAFRVGVDPTASEVLDTVASKIQQTLAAPATRILLANRIDEAFAAWRQRPLGHLRRFISDTSREKLATFVADEARRLIQHRLADFATESGVWNIVTESIEGYNDKELGEMVRNLAKEEFAKITLLGGFVGAIVGFAQAFLPILIQMIK